jgi:hypothetical protein
MKITLEYDTDTKRYQIQVDKVFKDEQSDWLEAIKSFRTVQRQIIK